MIDLVSYIYMEGLFVVTHDGVVKRLTPAAFGKRPPMPALRITLEASSEDDASSFCRQPYRRLSTQLPPSPASAVAAIVSKIFSTMFYLPPILARILRK